MADLGAAVPDGATKSELSTFALPPVRVVWKSREGVANEQNLLGPKSGQAVLSDSVDPLVLTAGQEPAGILLDFGTEIAGSVELFTPIAANKGSPAVRIRFGESAAEAMAELDERGSENDHAVRDQVVRLPWLGKKTVGPGGFRFVRIDTAEPNQVVRLSAIRALLTLRDVPQIGSFRCSDERLNRIWQTGAWTVQLNMQDYLWDGIKRDRLVWLGDMNPEIAVVDAVFGANPVVPRSLDLIRDNTPTSQWMNTISSYSLWWILNQEEWYLQHGDLPYLRAQQSYLTALLKRLAGYIGADGRETLDGGRFLDWPTADQPAAVHEGLQALMILAFGSGERLMTALGDSRQAESCRQAAAQLRRHRPATSGRKSPAALGALSGLRDPAEVAALLEKGGPADLSTFYGFYVLQALGQADRTDAALDLISRYWGGMLDFGATTFWEEFDLEWTQNAGRIDELVPAGKRDLHGDFGANCYVGFRRSLCHGWAGGPTAFLSRHVLGITPAAAGFARVRIDPHLGHLSWAEGSYPTPHGAIRVRFDRLPDGSIRRQISLPAGVELAQEARGPGKAMNASSPPQP